MRHQLGIGIGALTLGALALAGQLVLPAGGGEQAELLSEPGTQTRVALALPSGEPVVIPPLLPPDGTPGFSVLQAPQVAPGRPLPAARLADARAHLRAGDTLRALHTAERVVEERWGRERDAARMLVGMLHRDAERPGLAVDAFRAIRQARGPLAPLGAWYEAEQEMVRGRHQVALRLCERYRRDWPEGQHADECLRVAARAHAQAGRGRAAREAAEAYDARNELGPISEQVELALATWQVEHQPEHAVPRLRRLAIDHEAPLTGRVAEELLAHLSVQGIEGATVPEDDASLRQRAVSMRDAGRRLEAWEAFEELIRRSDDDHRLRAWVEAEANVFGWRTRNWDFLAELHAHRYEASANPRSAWDANRVLGRGGRWVEAADWARLGLDRYGHTAQWRWRHEEVARTFLLAQAYGDARDAFDIVAARGGWAGRRAAYYAAFASLMHGDLHDAVERFDRIIERGRDHVAASRYWRARAHELAEQPEAAEEDRAWIREHAADTWYGLLLAQRTGDLPQQAPFARSGAWPGPELPEPPFPTPATVQVASAIAPATTSVPRPVAASTGWAELAWPMQVARPVTDVLSEPELPFRDLSAPPPSYVHGPLFDEAAARRELARVAERSGEDWPELHAVLDLADAGLYDLSGPLFAHVYEDWRRALRSGSRRAAARRMDLSAQQWRPLFLYTRNHHHTARFLFGIEQQVGPQLRDEAHRLSWPLAHDRYVWTYGQRHDIDPYLVLALMRQESTYNPNAVSRVGARGAMQIMPRTGHLLADLAHDTHFTAADLVDPVLSVERGIKYLGLLMERFDGVYPLAIAAYNGGPHNVSAWLQGTGAEMPLDAFVEHIPFRETRDYVKKVSVNYAIYLDLYAPEGSRVVLPPTPRGDDASIVDF